MGIDRRRNYGIMLDMETANTIQDGDKLDMSNVLPTTSAGRSLIPREMFMKLILL